MSFAYIVNETGATQVTLAEGIKAVDPADFVWLHLDGRESASIEWVERQAGIPEIARNALMALETRPRSDVIDGGAIVNLRGLGATPEDDPDALVSIRMWAEKGKLVSVCFRTPTALEPLCQEAAAGRIRDPGDLISTLAMKITDGLDPDVAELGDMLDDCETALDANAVYRLRRRITRARSQAIAYRRFVAPQRQALERLAGLEADWLDEQDRMHLREAADRCARMVEELESVRERSALMHEELTDLRAEQMDSRALLISIVALIFLPLTFLTGLLGMNVAGIPYAQHPHAFWWVVVLCGVVAIAITGYFIAKHWLSR